MSADVSDRSRPGWIGFVLHMRLPFQLVLSPIFLWGALFAERPDGRLALGFVVFHLFVCAGATVQNSFWDRDVGPVAFLRNPSRVTGGQVRASFLLQILGAALALRIGPAFLVAYLVLMGVGVAYSHPRIRIKRYLWASLVLVTLAHGGGAFSSGFLSGGGKLLQLAEPSRVLAAVAALLIPTGLFPITQVYQIEEDRARGDETLAVRYGWRAAFRFSSVGLLLGTFFAAAALTLRFGPADGAVVLVGNLAAIVLLQRWARRFPAQGPIQNHDEMVRFSSTTSLAFGILILFRLFVSPSW